MQEIQLAIPQLGRQEALAALYVKLPAQTQVGGVELLGEVAVGHEQVLLERTKLV